MATTFPRLLQKHASERPNDPALRAPGLTVAVFLLTQRRKLRALAGVLLPQAGECGRHEGVVSLRCATRYFAGPLNEFDGTAAL